MYMYVHMCICSVCLTVLYTCMYLLTCSQCNPSNADTNRAEESVLYREVSVFQRLKCMQEWYLGRQKVSLLERCPQFRGVLIEGFHCIHIGKEVCSECDDPGWCDTASDCSECDAGSFSVGLGAPTVHCVTREPSPSESVVSFPPGNDDVTSCGD